MPEISNAALPWVLVAAAMFGTGLAGMAVLWFEHVGRRRSRDD